MLPLSLPHRGSLKAVAADYRSRSMADAPKPLRIPRGTMLDEHHMVLAKTPNMFLARTEPYRAVGYDDQIRMMDHNDFFFRASGNLVSVLDERCFVLHCHNRFNRAYQKYREDVRGDKAYIFYKHYANRK